MNERYLFRGKRIDNGEWVQGYLGVDVEGRPQIEICNAFGGYVGARDVEPAAIGQCTGLRDRNGTLIFEGDILEFKRPDEEPYHSVVKWVTEGFMACHIPNTREGLQGGGASVAHNKEIITVIGNIHDREEAGTDVK